MLTLCFGTRASKPTVDRCRKPILRSRFTRLALIGLSLLQASLAAGALDLETDLSPFEGRIIDEVILEGNLVTDEAVIRRELSSKPGDALSASAVEADLVRLENLSIFAQVRVHAEPTADAHIRLVLTVKEAPAWIPVPALTYTEENGFSYGLGLSSVNLGGKAISLSARVYFGGADQRWARFSWPWISGNHLSLNVYVANIVRDDELRGFEEESIELTPEVGTYLGSYGRLKGKVSFFQMKSDVDGFTLTSDNKDEFFRLGAGLGIDTRDAWRNPRRGWQNEIEVWATTGDGQFLTANVDLRRFLPAGRRNRVLLSSLLTVQSGILGVDVPRYFDFYMGGANSIRGYGIKELGAEFAGKNQLLGSVEFSHNLVPLRRFDFWKFALRLGLDAAVFADAGVAWTDSSELAMNQTHAGGGIGLRLLVPGSEMIRFDLGWSPTEGFVFHFASGSKPAAQRHRIR